MQNNENADNVIISLGFIEINYVPAFQEYELEFLCSEGNKARIMELTKDSIEERYEAED